MMLLFLLFAWSAADVKLYANPGTYDLIASDYEYATTVTFEMWSAGAGGNVYQVASNNYYHYNGASGSYVLMTLYSNNNNFRLIVGQGGNAGKNGTRTEVSNNDVFASIDGGESGIPPSTIQPLSGKLSTRFSNALFVKSLFNMTGDMGSFMISTFTCVIGMGGTAPFGGRGGIHPACMTSTNSLNLCDGKQPGGGGCSSAGKGGDGLIKMTYHPNRKHDSNHYVNTSDDNNDNLDFQRTPSF